MKKIHLVSFLLLITTISSCQDKKIILEKKLDCEILYDKYLEKFSLREKDSALFYINKCIKCDPSKSENKFIKVQLLTSMRDYKNAILVFDDLKLGVDDPSLIMQKGVLMLKIQDANSKKILEESYSRLKKIENPTFNNEFYKIALDNYFSNKDYSLNEVIKFKEKYKGKPYENQNINALEDLINKETKENVLFKLFSIN